jgi:hypothetical protein
MLFFFTTHCSHRLIVRSELDVPNFATRSLQACHHARAPMRQKVELWARNVRKFCPNVDFQVTFRNLLHGVKLRHGTDGFTSPPKEGVLRISFALQIRRIRLDVNMRPWVPKVSTLSLDHQDRSCFMLAINKLQSCRLFHNLHNVKGLKRKYRGV